MPGRLLLPDTCQQAALPRRLLLPAIHHPARYVQHEHAGGPSAAAQSAGQASDGGAGAGLPTQLACVWLQPGLSAWWSAFRPHVTCVHQTSNAMPPAGVSAPCPWQRVFILGDPLQGNTCPLNSSSPAVLCPEGCAVGCRAQHGVVACLPCGPDAALWSWFNNTAGVQSLIVQGPSLPVCSFYCPEPSKELPCPAGYFCKKGSLQPQACPFLTTCPEGSGGGAPQRRSRLVANAWAAWCGHHLACCLERSAPLNICASLYQFWSLVPCSQRRPVLQRLPHPGLLHGAPACCCVLRVGSG